MHRKIHKMLKTNKINKINLIPTRNNYLNKNKINFQQK